MLDEDDKRWIEATLVRLLGSAPAAASPLPRLTVKQFAVAVDHCEDEIRRKIRIEEIPSDMVFGLRPKKISPRALALFGVTPQEAIARLEERSLLQSSQPSPV